MLLDKLGEALLIASAVYAFLALLACRHRTRPAPDAKAPLPVSVLKPLCGGEPRLYENLRSFCLQDHPEFQVLFGVRDALDPAVAVVRRLQAEFPQLDLALVVQPQLHGSNRKVSNLINLLPAAKHDWLVLADADIEVTPDYLRRVTAPLREAGVGVVTCLYRARPLGGLWARLG